MPSRQRHFLKVLSEQRWLEPYASTDPCLFDELVIAYIARGHAETAGATRAELSHGDRALESIKCGEVTGTEMWGRAATAIRRFGEAYGAHRARRQGHALKKRYGKRKTRKEA